MSYYWHIVIYNGPTNDHDIKSVYRKKLWVGKVLVHVMKNDWSFMEELKVMELNNPE